MQEFDQEGLARRLQEHKEAVARSVVNRRAKAQVAAGSGSASRQGAESGSATSAPSSSSSSVSDFVYNSAGMIEIQFNPTRPLHQEEARRYSKWFQKGAYILFCIICVLILIPKPILASL